MGLLGLNKETTTRLHGKVIMNTRIRRRRRQRQYLYVIPKETPYGFKYNGYSNIPPEYEEFHVNFSKR